MIRFIGKFTKNGEIVAWRISDDGVEYNIAYKAIYHEFFFQPMIDSGYKFHDYDGNVTTPDGFELKDIIESKEYLSDTELIDLIDSIDSGMLEEKDVVQYFDRNVEVEVIDIPEPENPRITTRKEFLEHIDIIMKAKDRGIHKFSYQSINSYASKDSLFTLEEVLADKDDAKRKFVRLYEEHVMKSMADLTNLINMYSNKDDTENQRMVSILKGYFKYGIPGLNAKIIDIRIDMNPTQSYKDLNQTMHSDAKLTYGIRRKADYKCYSEDLIGIDYGTMGGDEEFDSNAYIGGMSVTSIQVQDVSEDFSVVAYGNKKTPPRIVIELISEDGIRATFMADTDEAHLYRDSIQLLPKLKMFSYLTIDNTYIPFSRIASNGINYISDSVLIRAYIAEQTKRSTVEPEFKNSFDLMVGIGVSPYYAPMYINKLIREGADQYVEISDVSNFTKLHYMCSDTFRNGFSEDIIQKYGTGEDDFTDKPMSEQLEFINEEISNLQSQGKYLVKPEIPEGTFKLASPEYNEWYDEYFNNEIGNINFVYSLLNGEQNIGMMATGMNLDSSRNDFRSFSVVYGAYMAAKENNQMLVCGDFLVNEIYKYIDLNILFRERKQTALGCLKDMVSFSSNMAMEASTLMYVTKVFRENANIEIDKSNRHYGFECIVYDKGAGSKGSQIFNSIYNQIIDELSRQNYKDSMLIAADGASLIIFKAIISKDYITPEDGICYLPYETTLPNGNRFKMRVKLGESYYNVLRNGSLISKKYSSNYDFCENQFSIANMKCNCYTVNASVNPWSVIPRKGFSIPEFNIFVNYFKMEELTKVYPASVISKIESTGAKVVKCLREEFTSNELFPGMCSIFSKEEESKLAKQGFFLERNEFEDIEAYINRTMYDIKKSKAEGKAVKNTLLKSDIQYNMFKPYIQIDGVTTEQSYYEECTGPITNRFITSMAPRILHNTWKEEVIEELPALETSTRNLTLERVKFTEISFEDKMYNTRLLTGDFSTSANAYITKGMLKYKNGMSKVLNEMTERDFEELCDERVAIQIDSNNYLIRTLNGLVKVGV